MPQPAVPQPKKFVYLKSGWPVALLEFALSMHILSFIKLALGIRKKFDRIFQ